MPLQGKCPVDHSKRAAASSAEQPETSSRDRGEQRLPVAHSTSSSSHGAEIASTTGGRCPFGRPAVGEQESTPRTGKCPVDHEALTRPLEQNGPREEVQKPVCPFGFTSEASSMTSLHCPKCRSLFYDCVRTNCGHDFCQDCIKGSSECLKCGDVLCHLEPEGHTQDLVDTFMSTHSSDETFLEGKPIMMKDESGEKDVEATRATFLLEVGLRSFAGGNFPAAAARLEACRQALVQMAEKRGGSADLSSQLGAVCGSQGDCSLQLGDPQAAAASYEVSIKHLQECPSPTSEVRQALTVTQNKLGDLWYRAGNLEAAKDFYSRALALRRKALRHAEGDEHLRAQLDLALSLLKVADVNQVLGENEAWSASMQEARQMVTELEQMSDQLHASLKKRLAAMAAFVSECT